MQELEEAERYSIAALFTLALHSSAASAESYDKDDWGEEEEEGVVFSVNTQGKNNQQVNEERDGFWGRDLAASGGFLDAVYWQLGLPCFKWAGLKALPSVAGQRATPDVFRSTVRSLISVLDAELAAKLPPITLHRPCKPKPQDVWASVISGSSDEEVFDIQTVHELGGGSKRVHKSADDACHHTDFHSGEPPTDTREEGEREEMEDGKPCPKRLEEEIEKLKHLAAGEAHEESRKVEYENLLHIVEEFEKSPLGSPISQQASLEMQESGTHLDENHTDALQHARINDVYVSPIAIAGVWELLQCTIGASFAASEAAAEIGSYDKDRFGADGDATAALKRQGPPPCVRWYDARARVALKMVCRWLHLDENRLATLEVLLGSDRAPATSRQSGRSHSVSDRYRYWKVGAAAVGGGALFAVTGGLAAPAIAAGVGSILGIVPGAAGAAVSAAGFLSTQAGVAALTTTMATAGAATTGSKMAYRTADVKDFGFYLLGDILHSPHKETLASKDVSASHMEYTMNEGHVIRTPSKDSTQEEQKETTTSTWQYWFSSSKSKQDDASKATPSSTGKKKEDEIPLSPIPSPQTPKSEGIKLSTTIAISGWITSDSDYIKPWSTSIIAPASDRYALVWCRQELLALTSALGGLIAKGVTGQAARYGVQHLVAGSAGLVTALGPTVLLGAAAGLLIENAWTTAGERSDKAGKLLAHILLQGGTGGRPVTLIAHSMGTRVVMSCMQELISQLLPRSNTAYDRKKKRIQSLRGLIQDVILMGAPITPDTELWSEARSLIAGRFVNCYSTRDWLLTVMFWQGVSKPAAGLGPVDSPGIENVNCSDIISGHAEYLSLENLTEIFSLIGYTV